MEYNRLLFNTLTVFLVVVITSGCCGCDEFDWGSRVPPSTCVDIPKNLSLCNNIGYTRMRLPNGLEHDRMSEIFDQSKSWIPLLHLGCHKDTQLFIGSLFCPVCVIHPMHPDTYLVIYPCRSLCENVRNGCEVRMKKYNYPWPEMFACNRFPINKDMCIDSNSSSSSSNSSTENRCVTCDPYETVENIMDYYCQSSFAMKAKLKKIENTKFIFRKPKLYKPRNETSIQGFNGKFFTVDSPEECCARKLNINQTYFLTGQIQDGKLTANLIMQWNKHSIIFRSAMQKLNSMDCSIISQTVITDPTLIQYIPEEYPRTRSQSRLKKKTKKKISPKRGRRKHKQQTNGTMTYSEKTTKL